MRSEYQVVSIERRVTIKDTGHCAGVMTVTNDVEAVVNDLHTRGILQQNDRLFYYDSDGALGEIAHNGNGNFTAFLPGGSSLV